jgi:hypothetical protein
MRVTPAANRFKSQTSISTLFLRSVINGFGSTSIYLRECSCGDLSGRSAGEEIAQIVAMLTEAAPNTSILSWYTLSFR